jgi:biotin carboxyl carrier protein
VSNETITYRDLLELVELMKSASHFGEFHLKLGDLEVDLKRGAAADARPVSAPTEAAPRSAQAPQASTPAAAPRDAAVAVNGAAQEPAAHQRHGHVGGGEVVTDAVAQGLGTAAGKHVAPRDFPPGAVLIKSPMVGMFYRASEPGARPFAEVGQQVEAETTVCIIEVMKLMNSIPAGQKGTITHILVGDSEPVEYGQVLMVLDPA